MKKINKKSIIVLEAAPSKNNNLIKKIYIPMGFKPEGDYNEHVDLHMHLLSSNIERVLKWCTSIYGI